MICPECGHEDAEQLTPEQQEQADKARLMFMELRRATRMAIPFESAWSSVTNTPADSRAREIWNDIGNR